MVQSALHWLRKFAKDSSGETQVEIAALSTGVTVTVYLLLKTLLRTLT
jgi:Flp pilus assembly pilin Flp